MRAQLLDAINAVLVHLRAVHARPPTLEVRHGEYETDIPENRILRTAPHRMAQMQADAGGARTCPEQTQALGGPTHGCPTAGGRPAATVVACQQAESQVRLCTARGGIGPGSPGAID